MLLGRILISFLYSICSGFPAPLIEDCLFSLVYSCLICKDKVHIGAYLKFIHFYFVVLYMIFKAFTVLVFIWLLSFSHSVVSDSLQPHGSQNARLPCPSPSPRAWSNSCPLSQWCHSTISFSVIPFYSCLLSFPASGSFLLSQRFTSGGQSFSLSISPSKEYLRIDFL